MVRKCGTCGQEGHNASNTTFHPSTNFIIPEECNESEPPPILFVQENYVLELCAVPSSVNIDMLKAEINEYMAPRLRYYKKTKRNLSIEEEFSEWWMAEASNGSEIGKGNKAMDVITGIKEGIDTTCVILEGVTSNEKSLMQGFKVGNDLDTLFNDNKDIESLRIYMEGYKSKLVSVKRDKDMTDLYIAAFISTKTQIYMCFFKINTDAIDNVSSAGFTEQGKSIHVKGIIDPKYGCSKLYKSKKRVELRFKNECIKHNNVVLIYTIPPATEPTVPQ